MAASFTIQLLTVQKTSAGSSAQAARKRESDAADKPVMRSLSDKLMGPWSCRLGVYAFSLRRSGEASGTLIRASWTRPWPRCTKSKTGCHRPRRSARRAAVRVLFEICLALVTWSTGRNSRMRYGIPPARH